MLRAPGTFFTQLKPDDVRSEQRWDRYKLYVRRFLKHTMAIQRATETGLKGLKRSGAKNDHSCLIFGCIFRGAALSPNPLIAAFPGGLERWLQVLRRLGITMIHRHSIACLSLIFGALALNGTARANSSISLLSTHDYETSTTTNGGLCNPGTANCPAGVPSQGVLQLTAPLSILINPIVITPDSNYLLQITITDQGHGLGHTAGSNYQLALNGVALTGTATGVGTPNVFTVIERDGMNPGAYSLTVTNLYLQQASPAFTNSYFTLSASEVPAPEPASLALFGSGVALLSLLRRRQARR